MKLKHIAAAALAVASVVPAVASIDTRNINTAEMFLVVGDENGSFLFDTGLKISDFLSGVTTPGYARQWNVSGAAWTSYKAADTNLLDGTATKGTRWAFMASAGSSLPSPEHFLFSTVNPTQDIAQFISNGDFDSSEYIGISNVVGNAGQTQSHLGSYAVNGQSHNKKGEGITHFLGGFTLETSNFLLGNKVGDVASMISIAGSSEEPFEATLNTNLTALYGMQVSFDGTTLSVTTPVPEPETYALMLAGLVGVCMMTRRRRAD